MKKVLCLLLLFGLLSGCQPAKMAEPAFKDTPADVYLWEEVGATILLPEGIWEVCDVVVAKDSGAGTVWFQFKDGGDTAFWLKAYGKDSDWDSPLVEQLGVRTLGETETHVIQVMTSTCGTLNNEKIRPLWEEMRMKVAQMTEENIMIS